MNLIGEHTDYSDGFALPLALEYGTAAAARAFDQPVLRVHSAREGTTIQVAAHPAQDGSSAVAPCPIKGRDSARGGRLSKTALGEGGQAGPAGCRCWTCASCSACSGRQRR